MLLQLESRYFKTENVPKRTCECVHVYVCVCVCVCGPNNDWTDNVPRERQPVTPREDTCRSGPLV